MTGSTVVRWDFPIAMVTKGYNKFAYVVNTENHHHSYKKFTNVA